MLYEEFKEKIKELGLFIEYNADFKIVSVCVNYAGKRLILSIMNNDKQYDSSFYEECDVLSPEVREKLFDLTLEYAKTPAGERGQIKPKYKVIAFRRKKGTPKHITEHVAFYFRNRFGELDWTYNRTNNDESQKFTMKQIKEYELENYEKIQVED